MASSSRKRLASRRPTAADFLDSHPFAKEYTPLVQDLPERLPEATPTAHLPKADVPVHSTDLNETCVTPLIAALAAPYFAHLRIAGFELPNGIDGILERKIVHAAVYRRFLQLLLDAHYGPKPSLHYDIKDIIRTPGRRRPRNTNYTHVKVRREIIQIGDIVILARGSLYPGATAPPLPKDIKDRPDAHAGTLFWFAKVLSIRQEDHTFHGQWLEHGSRTVLEELAHPQELFMTNLCDDIKLSAILTKCWCKRLSPGKRPCPRELQHFNFFYSLVYDRRSGSFTDVVDDNPMDDNSSFTCALCAMAEKEKNKDAFSCIRDRRRMLEGFSYQGEAFHYADGVMIQSEEGPCLVGQILDLSKGGWAGDFRITVRLFGRMSRRKDFERAQGVGLYEDRRLFLSETFMDVYSSDIIGKCYVIPEPPPRQLKAWSESSPAHFFFSHVSKSLRNDDGQSPLVPQLHTHKFILCGYCMEQEQTFVGELETFLDRFSERPLRIFDPFAGVGAFALGMCGRGHMCFTHAIEIDTSAARTIKRNSPGTIVYNQCSNKLLEAVTRNIHNIHGEKLDSLDPDEDGQLLPPLPKPDQVDCIVSGFPCQPHSTLNMYPKARDPQNELFLNAISWVDLMKPKYCVFENVEGFVRFRLCATQEGHHRVAGGIELGGLKFVVRGLVCMGYQVRFGLLQAAYYGTPQSRVRFFLVAAKSGYRLPDFPKPTHDFSPTNTNSISFAIAGSITPTNPRGGTAPMQGVTIEDAIEDLKRWDWEDPHKVYSRQYSVVEPPERQNVMKVKCCQDMPWCGPSQDYYEHLAYTAFQAFCQKQAETNIQHITPCFDEETVERAVNIGLAAGSDYLSLNTKPKLLNQFQMINPNSANARLGFRPGMYGRLGAQGHFRTIVTNIRPTAKQGWIMNPWCRRILSVRELARAQGFPDNFEFVARDNKITTMHRQIGNAVPWPLADALSGEIFSAVFEDEEGTKLKDILARHDQNWLEVHALAKSLERVTL